MGYEISIVPCLVCKTSFPCNADLVPSIKVDGVKKALCYNCHEEINKVRIERGIPPFPPPLPGAYEPKKVNYW